MLSQRRQNRANLSRAFFHFWSMLLVSRSGPLFQRISCQAFGLSSKRAIRIHTTSIHSNLFVATSEQQIMVAEEEKIPIRAKLVSLDTFAECGARLRQGDLVAFPTETVYGLGCNALDPSAIQKVFRAKERPLTDPLISHVTKKEVAYNLWEAAPSSLEGNALRLLCDKFWPGPLTLVSKAASHVPDILMANTGFVACRAPKHPISIALIDAAGVPIAAPSANKFGHVSPTRANHVWDDLLHEDVWIMETDDQNAAGICDVGVESSVAKIEMFESESGEQKGKITLLRQGAISVGDIKKCLEEAGLGSEFIVQARTKKACHDTVATVAPGQSIRHYSPDIPSYILSQSRCEALAEITADDKAFLSKSVLIDFGGKLKAWKGLALAYRELSGDGTSAKATQSVFETLRWAERVDGANQILFPEIVDNMPGMHDALTLALKDRLTRAASGVVIDSLKN